MSLPKSSTPLNDPAHLLDLVSAIQTSVQDIIGEYQAVGAVVPPLTDTDVTSGPLDRPEDMTPKLLHAVHLIEAACVQLCATVVSPVLSLVNGGFAFHDTACLQFVVWNKIPDLLGENPEGVSAPTVANKIGVDTDKVARILRYLTTKHIFQEVGPNIFANNRLSIKLLSKNSCYDFLKLITYDCFKPASLLYETYSDKTNGAPKTAYERCFGVPMFSDLHTPEHKETAERFNKAMVGWGDATGRNMLTTAYPWNSLPTMIKGEIRLCDVGGGVGHAVLAVIREFKDMPFKAVVQDMPNMIEQGKQHWEKELPVAVEGGKVAFVPIDFFKDIPVLGCDVYNIRHVLHNWSDVDCAKILRNVVEAMKAVPEKKDTVRLLINDIAFQQADPFKGAYQPNDLGKARVLALDVNMLALLGEAKERTAEDYVRIGSSVGLKLLNIYNAGPTHEAILEFSLA